MSDMKTADKVGSVSSLRNFGCKNTHTGHLWHITHRDLSKPQVQWQTGRFWAHAVVSARVLGVGMVGGWGVAMIQVALIAGVFL